MVNPIVWDPNGTDVAATLMWNPEYLLLRTDTVVSSDTTIHLMGVDQYGSNIEAKVFLPANTPSQVEVPFVDPSSGQPVAFSKITGITQQNGTHCNSFDIKTYPYNHEQYLGLYENSTGYFIPTYQFATGPYVIGGNKPTILTQNVPVQPVNPEPIKILINWQDFFGVLQPVMPPPANGAPPPNSGEWMTGGAKGATTLTIEGLDQNGSKLIVHVNIHQGDYWVNVDQTDSDIGFHTFAEICKVWGGFASGDSYYIFTEPMPERNLFEYYIRINHLTLYPQSYDILANPAEDPNNPGSYPGVTNVALVLMDLDNHTVRAPLTTDVWPGTTTMQPIVVNWWTSGGEIQPSYSQFTPGSSILWVNLTADTNPRTIKIAADANVPTHGQIGLLPNYAMNLYTWTEIVFDGVNSVLDTSGWPIGHNGNNMPLQWGYTTADGTPYQMAAPPEPPLSEVLGGPLANSTVPPYKLNGPIYEISIPLYPGCNLISSPVVPIFGTYGPYYTQSYTGDETSGIPFGLLFNMTSGSESIEAIWYYTGGAEGDWNYYIPGVSRDTGQTTDATFRDGVGYWIKAEKTCTLEISGVTMENAPFVPPEYTVYSSWNLMGFTSVTPMATSSYLESLNTGYIGAGTPITIASSVGPVWVFDSSLRSWSRDPATLWPGQGFWMNYKLEGTAYLAP